MAAPKTILAGDRVCYVSAAGIIRGEVVKIMKHLNAANYMINWIYIEYYNDKSSSKYSVVRLPETALEMMKFEVIFRDWDAEAAQNDYDRMVAA